MTVERPDQPSESMKGEPTSLRVQWELDFPDLVEQSPVSMEIF